MEAAKLVSMANQIAAFFLAYPEKEAEVAVREHITLFWTPGMRKTLDEHISETTAGVEPLVVKAFTRPAPDAESPIGKQAEGPATLGELATDAG